MSATRTIQGVTFSEGQPIMACWVNFTLHAIGKRSLIIRPISRPSSPKSPAACDGRPVPGSVVAGGLTTKERKEP